MVIRRNNIANSIVMYISTHPLPSVGDIPSAVSPLRRTYPPAADLAASVDLTPRMAIVSPPSSTDIINSVGINGHSALGAMPTIVYLKRS